MAKTKAGKTNGPVEKPAEIVKSRTVGGPSETEIRMRAFEIFLERSGRPGSPESDWLQAEWELSHKANTTPKSQPRTSGHVSPT